MSESRPVELRRQEAASVVGVSLRTLDRYRAEGRIEPILRTSKRGGFVAYYTLEAAERLRQELARENAKRVARRSRSQRQVRFRLLPSEHATLVSEAEAQGVSPNDYARALTREGLEAEWRAQMRANAEAQAEQEERLQDIAGEIGALRQELEETQGALTQALSALAQRTFLVSEERAQAWAKKLWKKNGE